MLKRLLVSPAATIALFALAAVLVAGGSVGAVAAAPQLVSGDFRAQVELSEISTALVENGSMVPDDGTLLSSLASDEGGFKIGKRYDERLAVANTGSMDEYVRVTVTRYWSDAAGKAVDLDPSLIELTFAEGGWTIDQTASTPERTVLYYTEPVAPGAQTAPFVTGVAVNGQVIARVSQLADGTNAFDYEDVRFTVRAVADAVQTHNGQEAMVSAWGRTVEG